MAGAADALAIELRDVAKSFGRVAALAGVGLSVARHSRVGIVGPSGGGKTTILKIVAGLLDAGFRAGSGRGRHLGAAAAGALRAHAPA